MKNFLLCVLVVILAGEVVYLWAHKKSSTQEVLALHTVINTPTPEDTLTPSPTPSVTPISTNLIPPDVLKVSMVATSTPDPTKSPMPTNPPTHPPSGSLVPTAVSASSSPSPSASPSPSNKSTPTTAPPSPQALFSSQQIYEFTDRFAGQYGVDANVIRAIAICESGFNPLAKNYIYVGLFQFGPTTWKNLRIKMGEDPDINLRSNAEEAVQTAAYAISIGQRSIWPNCNP